MMDDNDIDDETDATVTKGCTGGVRRKDGHKSKCRLSPETCHEVFQGYKFTHKRRRGIAVIIINERHKGKEPREGARKDLENLKWLFSHLKFEIRYIINKTREELENELKRIQQEDFSTCDCLALAVSSHGGDEYPTVRLKTGEYQQMREDCFETCDGYTVKVREVLAMFKDRYCPGLKDKPRLAFIQACRGRNVDDGMHLLSISSPKSVAKIGQSDGDEVDPVSSGKPVQERGKVFSQESQQPRQTNPPLLTSGAGCESFGARKRQEAPSNNETLQIQNLHQQSLLEMRQGFRQEARETQMSHNFAPKTQEANSSHYSIQESQPKSLFYAQESRGTQTQDCAINEIPVAPAPCYNDFLVMYAAPPGYYAFRNTDEGSWFITCLCQVFEDKRYSSMSLTSQLTRVVNLVTLRASESENIALNEKKQTPVIYSKLRDDVFFFA